MRNFSKIFKFSIAASTIIGIGAYQAVDSKNKISAAWTTNFEPSVQWDSNWDKYINKNDLNKTENKVCVI
jgi:hypothetical protein